ncbi:MAG: hypothetical protein N4A32_05975 [Marinifilaceae bacterium]|jgi:hypothetical protein|nr:hypothetical protein [Marinifilaceae bacterium]
MKKNYLPIIFLILLISYSCEKNFDDNNKIDEFKLEVLKWQDFHNTHLDIMKLKIAENQLLNDNNFGKELCSSLVNESETNIPDFKNREEFEIFLNNIKENVVENNPLKKECYNLILDALKEYITLDRMKNNDICEPLINRIDEISKYYSLKDISKNDKKELSVVIGTARGSIIYWIKNNNLQEWNELIEKNNYSSRSLCSEQEKEEGEEKRQELPHDSKEVHDFLSYVAADTLGGLVNPVLGVVCSGITAYGRS